MIRLSTFRCSILKSGTYGRQCHHLVSLLFFLGFPILHPPRFEDFKYVRISKRLRFALIRIDSRILRVRTFRSYFPPSLFTRLHGNCNLSCLTAFFLEQHTWPTMERQFFPYLITFFLHIGCSANSSINLSIRNSREPFKAPAGIVGRFDSRYHISYIIFRYHRQPFLVFLDFMRLLTPQQRVRLMSILPSAAQSKP